MRINQNIAALNAYRNLSMNESSMSKSLEKLSSGTRINRAGDDASGLVISQGLRAQIGGLNQATRNAQDGISVVQTAEGALNEVHNMLGRMRDLAVQANNTGSNDTAGRTAAQKEVTELTTEIDRLSDTTKFGSTKLLDGNYGSKAATKTQAFDADGAYNYTASATAADNQFTVLVTGGAAVTVTQGTVASQSAGNFASALETNIKAALLGSGNAANVAAASNFKVSAEGAGGAATAIKIDYTGAAGDTFTVGSVGTTVGALGITAGASSATVAGGATFQVGANNTANDRINVTIAKQDTNTLFGGTTLDLVNSAGAAIDKIDTAIATVSSTRADLGAKQNRFESVISNLQVATENLSSSESRIRDTDYASEMVKFTRGQILNSAATSMLGQANKLPQSVLGLLQG
jgi:flagellin